jgi:signal transduction histidine kinase/CheY-like chemotaxis protein
VTSSSIKLADADVSKGSRPSALSRLAAVATRIWRNQPVRDESEFAVQFREQAFADARVATWASGVVGCALMIQRTLDHPFVGMGDLLSGLVLFWAPPLTFALFVDWSRRNYQWILTIAFALRFVRVGGGIYQETRTVEETAMAVMSLTIFVSFLLRLPFKHAFCLTVSALAFISAIASAYFGSALWLPQLVPILLVATLALFASWRAEGRERHVFNRRMEAAEQASLARTAAAEAAEQAALAQRAMADARVQSLRAEGLQKHLQSVYTQRELLIRAIYHDANQPLASIGQLVFALEQRASGNDAFAPFRADLGSIAARAAELDRLLRGMHTLAKLGDFVPTYEPVSLNKLLGTIAERFREAARAKDIELIVRPRKNGDLYLWTDADAIERMLANLVSNAIKYTITGRVFVGCVLQKQLVRIDVLDSGVGIPDEKKNEIYQEFVRLEQEGVRDAKGLGLGLAIVTLFRDRLEGHQVEHKSAVGRGSRFSLTVPIAAAIPEIIEVPASVPQVLPTNKVYAVLVEDHKPLRLSQAALLHAAGYDVHGNVKAVTGVSELRDMFARFSHRAPNIVVSDYRLPDGATGNDVIALVDEFFPWARIPIVIYTADIGPELRRRRDHVYVLAKSSDPLPLLSLMQRAIWAARQAEAALEGELDLDSSRGRARFQDP